MGSQVAPKGGQKWENRVKCRKSGRDVSGMVQNGFKISLKPFCSIPDTFWPLFGHFPQFSHFYPLKIAKMGHFEDFLVKSTQKP